MIKKITSTFTLIIALLYAVGIFWGIVISNFPMSIVCVFMTMMFGFLAYNDYLEYKNEYRRTQLP